MTAMVSTDVARQGSSAGLIVFLHGWQDTPGGMAQLASHANTRLPDHDCWTPLLPIGSFLSTTRVAELADALIAGIDTVVRDCPDPAGYRDIVLVGHSLGAALCRAIWCRAHGARLDAMVDGSAERPWASRISRIVLMAGVNRGWDPDVPVSVKNRLKMWLGDIIENGLGARFLMLDIRRGAPFLTTMRLQMLATSEVLGRQGRTTPVIAHILGAFDNVVAPTDNFDRATLGPSEFYLEVSDAGHPEILELVTPPRRRAFELALVGTEDELRQAALSDVAIRDLLQEEPGRATQGPAPTDVVFIVHGIRDYGYWTRRLAIALKTEALARGLRFETISTSYGFFPIWNFLLPAEQRKRVGWLMDQYVAVRGTCGPETRFHYVGHSNGTYLLARALETCPAVRFDRVIFAGSMVHRGYDWAARMAAGQVGRVLNYVASDDQVVASIPAGLQAWGSDFGSAGHHGFSSEDVVQVCYVEGGHSASVRSPRWPEMVRFLLDGTVPPLGPGVAATQLVGEQTRTVRFLAAIAWLLPPVGVTIGAGIGLAFLFPLPVSAVLCALGFFVYVRVLTRVVTRL